MEGGVRVKDRESSGRTWTYIPDVMGAQDELLSHGLAHLPRAPLPAKRRGDGSRARPLEQVRDGSRHLTGPLAPRRVRSGPGAPRSTRESGPLDRRARPSPALLSPAARSDAILRVGSGSESQSVGGYPDRVPPFAS